jgi:prepilin-type N-terminal cleavage/methylation domain-containing protein
MKAHRGFTLIEILIVLVLIATVSSLIVIQVRDRDDAAILDKEIEAFIKASRFAQEEMLFRNNPLGIYFTTGGYAWFEGHLVDEEDEANPRVTRKKVLWKPLGDRLLRPHDFPGGMNITLYLEGTPVVLEAELPDEIRPQVLFLPDTDALPFELLMAFRSEERRSIIRYPSGAIVEKGEGNDA